MGALLGFEPAVNDCEWPLAAGKDGRDELATPSPYRALRTISGDGGDLSRLCSGLGDWRRPRCVLIGGDSDT